MGDGAADGNSIGAAGGIALIENPVTAEVSTMPSAALAACPSARAMSFADIVSQLRDWASA